MLRSLEGAPRLESQLATALPLTHTSQERGGVRRRQTPGREVRRRPSSHVQWLCVMELCDGPLRVVIHPIHCIALYRCIAVSLYSIMLYHCMPEGL